MKLSLSGFIVFVSTAHILASLVVVNNSDSGPGSLRQAILDANASAGGTVTFANVTSVAAP